MAAVVGAENDGNPGLCHDMPLLHIGKTLSALVWFGG
jgi:hypothetical protein